MALGLEDIKFIKQKNSDLVIKTKVEKVRPWMSQKELGLPHSGSNAVKKAKDIVKKNIKMVDELRKNFISDTKASEIDEKLEKKIQDFDCIVKKTHNINQIKSSNSFFAKLKKSLSS